MKTFAEKKNNRGLKGSKRFRLGCSFLASLETVCAVLLSLVFVLFPSQRHNPVKDDISRCRRKTPNGVWKLASPK